MKLFFKSKNIILSLLAVIILFTIAMSFQSWFHSKPMTLPSANNFNFYVLSDYGSGKNNVGDKPQIANQMNKMATLVNPRFIVSTGDNFHNDPPQKATDKVWHSNFEQYFTSDTIGQIKWYALLGNHDYCGTPNAEIEYSKLHPNWIMPSRYYTFTKAIDSTTSIRFVMLDSSPFIKDYWDRFKWDIDVDSYCKNELKWLENTLSKAKEQWIVVLGHHPIYNAAMFGGNYSNFGKQVNPLLRKYNVDFYFSGHAHTFQHNTMHHIDYISTSSALESRMITPWYFCKFYKKSTGYTLCSVNANSFDFYFIDKTGKVLYTFSRKKQ